MKKDQFDQICDMVRSHTTELESILYHTYRNHRYNDMRPELFIDELLSKQQGFTCRMRELRSKIILNDGGRDEEI